MNHLQKVLLETWVTSTFADDTTPEEQDRIVRTMRSLYDSDPDYWIRFSFDALYECAFPRIQA